MSARTQGERQLSRARADRAALESSPPTGRVRSVGAHHKAIAPLEVARVDPHNLAPAIDAIRTRIGRSMRAGLVAYLFIDEELRVFVLPETHVACARWCEERAAAFVGAYGSARGGERDRLAEDIGAHLEELAA